MGWRRASPDAGAGADAGESLAQIRARAGRLAALLPGMTVTAARLAASVTQGEHARRQAGAGERFRQYRPFDAQDGAAAIDWRRSARSDGLFVRESEWETAQSYYLWSDLSASMHYRSDPGLPVKRDRALLLLLALAMLLARGGERVALLGPGERPLAGRMGPERIHARLAMLIGRAAASPAEPVPDDHDGEPDPPHPDRPPANAADPAPAGAMPAISAMPDMPFLPRHAQAVLFGDFLAPPEEIESGLKDAAARRVGGVLVLIADPAEEDPPFRGRVRFSGLEGEGDWLVGRAQNVRDEYLARRAAHLAALQDSARAQGWNLLIHRTDRPPAPALMYLHGAMQGDGIMRRC